MAAINELKVWTHSNGGRKYEVVVTGKNLTVYEIIDHEKSMVDTKPCFSLTDCDMITLCDDIAFHPDFALGHVVGALKGRTCYIISRNIHHFDLFDSDTFVSFNSYIGNNDVPYTWVQGRKNTYLMSTNGKPDKKVFIPNYLRSNDVDPYRQIWATGKSCQYPKSCNTWGLDPVICRNIAKLSSLARHHIPPKEWFERKFRFNTVIDVRTEGFPCYDSDESDDTGGSSDDCADHVDKDD